jgi:hypothetical protein
MMWFDQSDEEKKKNILHLMAQLVQVDGSIHPVERTYISSLGTSFGFTKKMITSILEKPSNELLIPSNEQERMTILFYLLLLMKVDKHISREEEKLIFHFGFKLGFRETLMRDFVETIKAYSDKRLPPNILLEKVKKYMN